jgi:hypothetical protein
VVAGEAAFTAPPVGAPLVVVPEPGPTTQPVRGTFEPAPDVRPRGGGRPPRRGRGRVLTILGAAIAAAVIAAGLVVLLGKGGDGGEQAESPGTGTSPPPQTIQSFAPGTLIYRDDFSDNSGGWDETSQGGFRDGIRDGVYFQAIKRNNPGGPQVFASSSSRDPAVQDLGDVSVTVTATKVAGQGANGYGLACRTGGSTVSYYLVVGSTGGWAIEKSDGVNQPVLTKGTDPIIRKGNDAPNQIRGDCVGGQDGGPVALTLFVNGKQVGTVQDTPDAQVPGDSPGTLAQGTVGLVSVGDKGLEIQFDDFEVKAAG